MPAARAKAPDGAPDLSRSLGSEGEEEYRRLVRSLRMARGSFFLFPVESDLPPALRDALLSRLRADLAAEGLCLRVGNLTRDVWNVFDLPELQTPFTDADVFVLTGLGETPGIVPEAGAKPTRPPALAILNTARASLHKHVPVPFVVWCPPYAYTALLEHAPDFFDHYVGLFAFPDQAPAPPPRLVRFEIEFEGSSLRVTRAGSCAALAFYEETLARLTTPTVERARALIGLSEAVVALSDREQPDRLARARAATEEALSLLSPEAAPYEWARAHSLLSTVFLETPTGDRATNLRRAIRHARAALRVFKERAWPYKWADVQNNLGIAYLHLPPKNSALNLRRAVRRFEAALRVCTETAHPYEWAVTNNNMGAAFANLPTDDEADNLRRAIACYHSALRVLTRDEYPSAWALTQLNLGSVYTELPTGDRADNYRLAAVCYEAVLSALDRHDFPREWANAQRNLAELRKSEGNEGEALKALESALETYRRLGLEHQAEDAENLLRQWGEPPAQTPDAGEAGG